MVYGWFVSVCRISQRNDRRNFLFRMHSDVTASWEHSWIFRIHRKWSRFTIIGLSKKKKKMCLLQVMSCRSIIALANTRLNCKLDRSILNLTFFIPFLSADRIIRLRKYITIFDKGDKNCFFIKNVLSVVIAVIFSNFVFFKFLLIFI